VRKDGTTCRNVARHTVDRGVTRGQGKFRQVRVLQRVDLLAGRVRIVTKALATVGVGGKEEIAVCGGSPGQPVGKSVRPALAHTASLVGLEATTSSTTLYTDKSRSSLYVQGNILTVIRFETPCISSWATMSVFIEPDERCE
jgi:hypothetical protein